MTYRGWLFWLVLLVLPLPAGAATYYVATNGTDTSSCGPRNTPCATYEHVRANRGFTGGDTLIFRGGTYPLIGSNTQAAAPPNGTAPNPTIIAGENGETVTLPSIAIVYYNCYQGPAFCGVSEHITFRNFHLTGLAVHGCRNPDPPGFMDFSCGTRFIRFEDIEVSNNAGSCVGGGSGAFNITFLRLHIHHCGGTSYLDHGAYACIMNAVWDTIDAHHNGGYGLQLYESGHTAPRCGNGTIVRNSYLHHNIVFNGALLADGDNQQFYNNVVEANTGGGLDLTYGGGYPTNDNYQVYNNTFVNNGGAAITVGGGDGMKATNPKIRNNLFVGNSGFPINEFNLTTPTYSNNMCPAATDPGCDRSGTAAFVGGSGAGAYAITAQSGARNQGTPLGTFTTDRIGTSRPQGSQWDIGAYEYQEGGGQPFDFFVSQPTAVTLTQGAAITFPVLITTTAGTPSAVSFSTSTLPSGVSSSFAGSPCTPNPSCSANLTLTAQATAPVGTFTTPLLIGTSGSVVRQTTFQIIVIAPPPGFDFTISNPGPQTLSRGAVITIPLALTYLTGTAGPVNLSIVSGLPSGVSQDFNPLSCTPSCTSTLTLAAASDATVGSTTLTVRGVGGGQTRDLLFTLTITNVMSSGNPIYVRGTAGNNANSCIAAESQGTAKQTIASACECMTVPGKILFIEGNGNTYAEAIDTGGACPITGGNGPSYDTATRLEGYGAPFPIIQAPVGTDIALWVRGSGDHYTIFKRLVFDAANHTGNGVAVWSGTHHIKFEEVDVRNTLGGFETFYILDANNVELINVFIHDAGTEALTLHGTINGFLCQSCHLFSAGGAGLFVSSSGTKTNLTFDALEIRNNAGNGLDLGASTGTALQNLVAHSNGGKGVWVRTGASGTRAYNNTIYANTGVGLQCDAGAPNTDLRNNSIYGNTGGNLLNNCGATVAKNLQTDPLFVAPPGNLHLADGSPAIDAGDNIPSLLTDYDGQPRQQGQQDIGAFERTQAPPVSPDVIVRRPDLAQAGWYF